MSLELYSILAIYLNSLAQIRISHIAFVGFLTGSIFIIEIRAFYLLREQDVEFAKRSFTVGGWPLFVFYQSPFMAIRMGYKSLNMSPKNGCYRSTVGKAKSHQQHCI